MATTNLVYYPQVTGAIEYYARSPHYRGEGLLPVAAFEHGYQPSGEVIILGRTGNFHHYDVSHIQRLRERGGIPDPSDTTLVVYDWHEDIDNDPRGTELTAGSWAYWGLVNGLYANMYIVGTNPRGFNELNPSQYEEEIRPTTEETLRVLDRVYLFPAESSYCCFKFLPECERFLEDNCSVDKYFTVSEGGFVQVRFKGSKHVTYRERKEAVVVSIDLDALKRSEVRTDCPQGVMRVDDLLGQLDTLRETGRISAFFICGLTESPELRNEQSLASLSRILSKCSGLLVADDSE